MTAYVPTVWHNDASPPMNAANLDKMTDELELQAANFGIAHTLPDWTDGAVPAITDAVPWNEIERVLTLVSAACSQTYVPVVWSEGWTPARNATNLNHIEQQLETNRTIIDGGTSLSGMYWGARIDGTFYSTCFQSPNADDVPFSNALVAGAAYDKFVQNAGKAPSIIQWSPASVSAYPPPAWSPAEENKVRSIGAFSEVGFGGTTQAINLYLAGDSTALGYIRDRYAIPMRDNGHPILFRPWWEMNLGWAWGSTALTATQYKTLWHNTWQVFQDAGATNVSFVWCCNRFDSGASQHTNAVARYVPANEVDVIAFNGYLGTTWWGNNTYRSPETVFGFTYDTLAAAYPTKPLGICEWGVTVVTSPGKDGFFNAMLDPSTGWLKTRGTRVKFHEYFNDPTWVSGSEWAICFEQSTAACPTGGPSGSAAWQSFKTHHAAPYYMANVVNSGTFPDGAKVPFPA